MSNNEEDGSTEAGAQGDATGVTGSVDPRTARRSFLGTVGSGLALAGPLGTVLGTASSHPTANFAYDPSRPVVDEEVTLDGTRSYDEDGTIERYYWEVERANGGTDSYYDAKPVHSWEGDGVFRITLEVTDNDGNTDTASKSISVSNSAPEADFSVDPSPPTPDEEVTLDGTLSSDSDGTIEDYYWEVKRANGGTDSYYVAQPTHSWDTGGEFEVTLEVTDNGDKTDTVTKTITVENLAPIADFSVDPSPPTPDEEVTLDGSLSTDPDGTIEDYYWEVKRANGGTDSYYVAQPTHSWDTGGEFEVTLEVTDNGDKTDTVTKTVTVENQAPTADFSVDPSPPTPDEEVTLDGSLSSDADGTIEDYYWEVERENGGFDSYYLAQPTHRWDTGGEFEVTLEVTDNGERTDSLTKTVTVANQAPVASFAVTPPNIEVGEEVTLDGTGSSDPDGTIEDYYWEVERESGGFDSYYVAQTTHHWQEKGQYEVSLEVTDNGEVTDTATETVYVGQFPPEASFTYSPSPFQTGTRVTFDASGSSDLDGSISEYRWRVETSGGTNDTRTGETVEFEWTTPGTYAVELTVVDDEGNEQVTSQTVEVDNRAPTAAFRVVTDSPTQYDPVRFDASGSSDLDGEVVDYEWTFETVDGSPSAAGERVEHTFETAGEHTVRLEVEDDNGAGDSSTKTVSVAEGATPSPSPTPSPTEKETPTERGTPTSRPIDSSPTPTPSSSQPDGTTETPTSRVPTATPRRSTTDSPTEAAGANGSSDDGGDSLSTILGGIGAVIAGAAGLYGVARFRRGGDDGPTAGGSGGGTTSPNGGHGGSSPSSKRAANGGSTSQSSGAAAVSSPPDPDPSSPLVDVSGVRPTDAAKLTNAGYESTDDLKRADESDLASVVGSALAARIVADVGRIDPGEADNSGEQSGGLAQEARQALMAVDGVESDDASDLLAAGYESRSDLREARQTELSAVVGNVLASRVKDDVGYPGDGNEPDSGDSDSTDDSGPNSDSTGQPETSQSAPSGGADDVDVLQGLDGVDAATKRALAEAGYTSIEDLRTASTTALSKVVGHDTAVRVRDEVGFVRTGDVSADGTTQEQPETGSDRSSATDSTAESGSDPDTGGGTAAGVVAGAGAATDGRDTEDASEGEDESKGEGERRANEERLAALYDAADSRIDAAEEDPFAEPAATRDRLVRAHAEVVSLAEAASEYGDEELLSIARNALETVEARLEAFPALSGSIATARDRVPPDEGPSTTTSDSSLEAAREEYDTAIETATDVGFDTERLERERRAILDELDRREPPEEPTDSENADESGSTDSSDDEPATSDPAGSDDGPSVDGPTTDELVAELQRLDEETEGYPLTTEMRASGAFDPGNYYDAFDSWADALEAAGIDKKQRLVDDIRRVADVIDGVPNTTDMNEHGVHSSGTYSKAFGSWDDALAAAELNDRNALAADDSDGSGTPKSERTGSTTETGTEAETDPSTTETDSGSSTVATETEFATIGDITEDRRLDRPIAVKVTEVTADPGDRKQASLSVTDLAGGSCRFNVWAKHGVDVEWEPDQWYVLRQARGKSWTRSDGTTQRQLSSTKDLTVRRVGSDPPDGETKDQTGSASDADGDVADEEIGSEDRTASRSDVREESPSDDGDDGPSDDGDDGPSDGGDDGPSDDGILGEVFSEFDEMEDDE